MRVAICTDGIHPFAMGGMQRHSRLLVEHLARNGKVQLVVLHPHAEQVFVPSLGIEEVQVPDIDRNKFYLRELWRYSGRVADRLDVLKPDVILSQGFCVWKGIDRFTDRLILHPHGLEMFQMRGLKGRLGGWPFRAVLMYMVRRSRVVISLGGMLTELLARIARGSGCRVVPIPNAVDLPAGTPSPTPPGTIINLLFVGRFAFNKGLDVLMTVATRLLRDSSDQDLLFHLAGDGPLLEHYRAGGLPPNVILLGRVDDDRLASLYRASDALILPTRFEGMPTVVLEAMAAGKPIIVSRVGATAELVDVNNGYLLPAGDANALYHAVRSFAGLPRETRERMGAASYERVKEHFTWILVTGRFEELFSSLTATPRPPGDR